MRARLTAVLLLLSVACGGSSSKPADPPAATALAFALEPGPGSAVAPLSPAIQVELRDASGHRVVGATAAVTLALAPGGGAAMLAGNTSVAAVAGVATFAGLRLTLAGTGYRLVATATGLASATSTPFDVAGGPPTQLQFVAQPASGRTSTPLAPSLEVRLLDSEGNRASGEADVTVTFGSGPPGGVLTGSTTLGSTGGVASFTNLAIDGAGTYSLRAALPGGGAAVGLTFSLTDAWAPVGPSGGLVAIAADPGDVTKALAGGQGGLGLWRTVDGGGHWAPVPRLGGRSLRPVFERAGVAWAFGDSLWRSADGGASWTEVSGLGLSIDNPVVGLAFHTGTHATAAVGGYVQQLLTSADDGATWAAVSPAFPAGASLLKLAAGPGGLLVLSSQGFHALAPGALAWTAPVGVDTNPWVIAAHPTDPAILLVGGIYGLHRSGDGGATWSVVAPYQFKDLWFDPATPGTVLAAAASVGILRSTDGGLTFDPLSAPQALEVTSLSGTPARLYLGADTGPWVSTDAGVTFTAATTGLQAGRFTAVAVSPATSGLVLAGAVPGSVFRTTDGGATWTSVLFMPSQAPIQIVFDPRTPARVYLVNWGDLMVSTDAGATWGYLAGSPHGLNSLAIGGGPSTTLWVGDQNGTGVWRSPDAGATWSRVLTRPSASHILSGVGADAADPLVGYVNQIDYTSGGPGTGTYRTTDGGTTWTKLAVSSYGGQLVTGPAAGELWRLASYTVQRSTDRGATFTSLAPPLDGVPYAMSFDAADPARAAIGTLGQYSWLPGDGVQITGDSGASWRASRSGHARFSTYGVAIDPRAPATLYAATSGGGLLKSTSGGF